MSKVTLQFHCEPAELEAWAGQWSATFGLRLVAERFFPTPRFVTVGTDGTHAARVDLGGTIDRFWLLIETSPLSSGELNDGTLEPMERMVIAPGLRVAESLRESAIGAMSDDPTALKLWRRIIRDAKSRLHKGAWVVGPVTGTREAATSHGFSDGAIRSFRTGVRLLAVAGSNYFEPIDDSQ